MSRSDEHLIIQIVTVSKSKDSLRYCFILNGIQPDIFFKKNNV